MNEEAYAAARNRMVRDQIAARGIRQASLLEAMRTTPRHVFVDAEYRDMAYSDGPLPIGQGQTISQPYIVALMTELLELRGGENVLEVGTGSGYQAAILAQMARQVHTIERHSSLAEHARRILEDLHLDNVRVHIGDGSQGLEAFSPYQGILVTAAAPQVPQPLLDQLAEGGRLVIPVGSMGAQILECWRRKEENYERDCNIPVAFVPLRGEYGWQEERWRLF